MPLTTDQAEMTAAIAMKQSCMRGYHVNKDMWAAVVGEELVWRNSHRRRLCFISMKDSVVVGNLSRKISPVASGTAPYERWNDSVSILGKKTPAS